MREREGARAERIKKNKSSNIERSLRKTKTRYKKKANEQKDQSIRTRILIKTGQYKISQTDEKIKEGTNEADRVVTICKESAPVLKIGFHWF